jgi:RNA polymerase sigma-70 factor (ECF subfamily)
VEEAGLIAASQRGEVAAFNQLVIRYQQLMYNLAYRMVADPDLAADITQDAFLSAFNSIKSFRGGSFKSWLLRIASNACYDHFRRKKRRPTDSLDSMLEEPGSDGMFADNQAGPEERALSRELLAHVKHGLLQLPEEQRMAVILSDIEGLSYDEIAEVTNTSIGTVKSRLSRGRAHLRQVLMTQKELLPAHLRQSYEGTECSS